MRRRCLDVAILPPKLLAFLIASSSAIPANVATQYRPHELDFVAAHESADAFDPDRSPLIVRLTHESGRSLSLRGFWDGARTWRARFQPELAGRWTWSSFSDDPTDAGLHGRAGEFTVAPPGADAPEQQRHGGILRVSADHTHLTYANGTPFFWLADTWWGMPSDRATPEHLGKLIAKRQSQGFTAGQMHGHRNLDSADGSDVFQLMEAGGEPALAYWRKTDAYYRLAEGLGWHLCVGFYGYVSERKYSLKTHHRLWAYFLARYGAYPVTFLITQEYNQPYETPGPNGKTLYDPTRTHGPFFTALGGWIHDRDPYRRAMTAHSAVRSREKFDAWPEPWYGFALLQNGHFSRPDPAYYRSVCAREPSKPVIEGEMNYEGFSRTNAPPLTIDAAVIRMSAYGAVQSGCAGYSYGAQGLYAHITNPKLPGPTARWGPVLTWDQALELEGARHLAHLSGLYRSLSWWRLRPLPKAVDDSDAALAKTDGDGLCLIYFLPSPKPRPAPSRLIGFGKPGISLTAQWFDPRTGQTTIAFPPAWDDNGLDLPPRPDIQDWILILRRHPLVLPAATQARGASTP
ncbi:MAG TPA: DUF4038 domain-containing protein [Verrucomicrobiae bacterium]|nr:DUF4038 domain-containing protein [Verrucomicrobiae bacterium]